MIQLALSTLVLIKQSCSRQVMIYLSCAESDVQLTIFVRVSEFTSDNVVAVELAQFKILIYHSNDMISNFLFVG